MTEPAIKETPKAPPNLVCITVELRDSIIRVLSSIGVACNAIVSDLSNARVIPVNVQKPDSAPSPPNQEGAKVEP